MGITIIIQTRVRPEASEAFARWQDEAGRAVAAFPGFTTQTVMPPSPPQQVDWVVLQRFASEQTALAWLESDARQRCVEGVAPMVVGVDDVHLVRDGEPGARPAPVSAVISTRVKPGHEPAYREWERRIAAAQAKAAGFQGYRFEQPIPGVQDDWLAILRFDTEAHLSAWLDSPERGELLQEAGAFIQDFHTRIARTGFDQWFPVAAGDTRTRSAWKENMLVLLFLYPVVFLFGAWVQTPWLMQRAHLPLWLALFIGNAVSIVLLNWLVPWGCDRFAWWLRPATAPTRTNLAGAALLIALYGLSLLVFSRFP